MKYYLVSIIGKVGTYFDALTYESETDISIGVIVSVPVGKKTSLGVIIKSVAKPKFKCKNINSIVIDKPLPSHLLSIHDWMSEYYATKSGIVWQTILPGRIATKPRRSPPQYNTPKRTKLLLNKTQTEAVQAIRQVSNGTILLHGITGSGKTEIYKTIAEDVIASGRSVIMLVPEISLTAQLVEQFTSRFDNVLVTHSAMTPSQRNAAWRQALTSDQPMIIIGPRSALFMPVQKLGLIIIDECHEPTYKQDSAPRYNSSTVATMIARYTDCRLILGSATPSLTDYYLALHFKRPIITLDRLAQEKAVRPTTKIIDISKRDSFVSDSNILSAELLNAIRDALNRKKQVLLFHNRRGTAGLAMCDNCGWTATCPNCFIPLTLHSDQHRLICHLCNYRIKPITTCPDCQQTDIKYRGIGTKRIESEMMKLFPAAHIGRFDGDVAKGQAVHDLFDQLKDGTIDVIIGTQTIAKGLDLPNLAVVGVVQADAGLALPDFAASERTFQLIAQACGRVGRTSQATTAIIQSYKVDSPAVKFGASQDYDNFYHTEIKARQHSLFPPFAYLLKISCSYKTERGAIRAINQLARQLKDNYGSAIKLLGPAPAFYERINSLYRWQIVIRSPKRSTLTDIVKNMPNGNWQIDIDPASLLNP